MAQKKLFWMMCLSVVLLPMGCGDSPNGPQEVGEPFAVDLPNGEQMALVWIPPGRMVLGSAESEEGRFDDEGPQFETVFEAGFYMGQYEVTQGQWQAVMGTTPWVNQTFIVEGLQVPAVYITWFEAQEFIHKLNVAAGDSLYRLPTEAEWEYAARAGTTTRWWFGDNEADLVDHAWYADNTRELGSPTPREVGMKPANPWGLYDVVGNAREWVQDWYAPYSGTVNDIPGPAPRTARVVRGGGHGSDVRYTRSSTRAWRSPHATSWGFGMRVVRIVK